MSSQGQLIRPAPDVSPMHEFKAGFDLPFVTIKDGPGQIVIDLRNATTIMYVPLQGVLVCFKQGANWQGQSLQQAHYDMLVTAWKSVHRGTTFEMTTPTSGSQIKGLDE